MRTSGIDSKGFGYARGEIMTKCRPIIFDEHSVRAILAGNKTQTRRVAKGAYAPLPEFVKNPYGEAGDLLWVKERHYRDVKRIVFDRRPAGWRTMSPMFMPKAQSRITLRITEYRLEYLQDITDEDIVAEGVGINETTFYEGKLREMWIERWDSINAKRGYSWESNPVVHVIGFEVAQ
jgi:hypothetical protein